MTHQLKTKGVRLSAHCAERIRLYRDLGEARFVLGLLAALVSNTHADIVAVLCVIALLGLAPAEVGVTVARSLGANQQTPSGELLALGDSYMSGEGAKTFISDIDEAGNDTCRRAPTAYAVLAIGLEDSVQPPQLPRLLGCPGQQRPAAVR